MSDASTETKVPAQLDSDIIHSGHGLVNDNTSDADHVSVPVAPTPQA